jgi:hypothetical protein
MQVLSDPPAHVFENDDLFVCRLADAKDRHDLIDEWIRPARRPGPALMLCAIQRERA